MNNINEYLKALYIALIATKGNSYNYNDYKWVLGAAILDELKISNFHTIIEPSEPIFLFGIAVEIDCSNPYNVQLFEDITNKIHKVPEVEEYNTDFGYARKKD